MPISLSSSFSSFATSSAPFFDSDFSVREERLAAEGDEQVGCSGGVVAAVAPEEEASLVAVERGFWRVLPAREFR